MMKRIIAVMTTVAMSFPLLGAPIAQADSVTGPWTWTDLSGQLTERNNRPIWAVANANSNWFYTDGQNLWNGGQAYRYDGFTQVNITSDVRNAGVERVDDIVSDGTTILFLQDVVRLDNQLKVVAYRNNQYVNITNAVRNALNSNEGVSSVNGRNGTWYIVTTQNRLFRWDGTSNNPTQIGLPSEVQNNLASGRSLIYSTAKGFPSDTRGFTLGMLPINNDQWVLFGRKGNGLTFFYRYNGTTFTNFTSESYLSSAADVLGATSNGNKILFILNPTRAVQAFEIDSTTVNLVAGLWQTSPPYLDPTFVGYNEDSTLVGNNISWLLINKKKAFRIPVGATSHALPQDMGATRDFFITAAGDTNGRFLLGGAQSELGVVSPTFPLTAKLTMISEGVGTPSTGTTTNGDRVFTSSNGPRVTVQGDPSSFRIGNGKDFAYRVTATDTNGIDRTEIYVNDARIKTCSNTDYCEFRTTYFTNGASSRSVKFYVRSTDTQGNATDSSGSPDYLTVDVNSSASAGDSGSNNNNNQSSDVNGGINSWTWLDPNSTTLTDGQSVTFHVGAQDGNGIKRVEIYANGSIVRTCELNNATGNQSCSATLYANNYGAGTNIFVNAKVTDGNGNIAWTNSTTLTRSGTNSNNNQNTNGNGSVWTWLDPNSTTLNADQNVTFNVGAQDNDGLRRVEVYMNGSIARTCDYSDATGSQSCAQTIYGSNFAAGTNISLTAKATDRFGNVAWSNTVTLVRPTDGSGSGTGTQNRAPNTWEWLEPVTDHIAANGSIVYGAGAWDADGVRTITVWVNGAAKPSCNFYPGLGNQECRVTINASSFTPGSSVFANAVATDPSGNATWTQGKTFRIDAATGGTTPSNTNGSVNITASPAGVYTANQTITFTTTGSDTDGIARTDIYVNAAKVKTCTGSAACSIAAGPFPTRTVVTYGAVLTDVNGNTVSSGFKQLYRTQ